MRPILLLPLLIALLAPALRADDQAQSAETRMRAALRDSMTQLRDAQNQLVTVQATETQAEKDKADLQAKVDALTAQLKTVTDQATADKSAADKANDDFRTQLADQKRQLDTLNDSLKQWKDAYNQSAQLATMKEAARAQYAMQASVLQRTVDDREAKNLALFKLGNDILTRYEHFGLGDAIEAKEPFVGLSRVKLENLVQDYKNKLLDQAITTKPSSKTDAESSALESQPAPEKPAPTPTKQTGANAAPRATQVNAT